MFVLESLLLFKSAINVNLMEIVSEKRKSYCIFFYLTIRVPYFTVGRIFSAAGGRESEVHFGKSKNWISCPFHYA